MSDLLLVLLGLLLAVGIAVARLWMDGTLESIRRHWKAIRAIERGDESE